MKNSKLLSKILWPVQKGRELLTRQQERITIPVTNKNIVIITAFIKKGIVTVSYKGEHRQALYTGSELRNMMHGKDFDKNAYSFFHSVAELLKPLTIK